MKRPEENPIPTHRDPFKMGDEQLANKNCPKCYGRGYIGWDSATKKEITCRCVLKNFEKRRKLALENAMKPKTVDATEPSSPQGGPHAEETPAQEVSTQENPPQE